MGENELFIVQNKWFIVDDMQTTNNEQTEAKHRRSIMKTIAKRSFCTLATTSDAHRPHSAGVVYVWTGDALWMHVQRSSRKARNVASNDRVSACIPFRRMPVGPPYTIHFQASAELVDMQSAEARELIEAGTLKAITSHGELEMADACFIKVTPHGKVHSFGPGARMIDLIRDPIATGGRSFRYNQAAAVTS